MIGSAESSHSSSNTCVLKNRSADTELKERGGTNNEKSVFQWRNNKNDHNNDTRNRKFYLYFVKFFFSYMNTA